MSGWQDLPPPGMPYAEVIGDPIAHSRSPVIHTHWLELGGVRAAYRAAHVPAEYLSAYLDARVTDPDWRGCNVTMPHKVAVASLVHDFDPAAAAVGAVNTVVPGGGRLVGYNTDVVGILGPLEQPKNRIGDYLGHVATYAQIIGTGGAARAAAYAMSQRTDMEFYSRDAARAVELAGSFGLPEAYGMSLEQLGPIHGGDRQRYSHVVLNASPMGMVGKPPVPIDLSRYPTDTIVFDMVYAPQDTPLLRAARAAGLRTVGGLEMLVAQAAAAFALFFGQAPDRSDDAALMAELVS